MENNSNPVDIEAKKKEFERLLKEQGIFSQIKANF
jgi:hypothetical protein